MSRRTTGTFLLLIASILYAARYLTAAIFGSSTLGWSAEFYNSMLRYVGRGSVIWSLVALIVGLVYLVWAEVEGFVKSNPSA